MLRSSKRPIFIFILLSINITKIQNLYVFSVHTTYALKIQWCIGIISSVGKTLMRVPFPSGKTKLVKDHSSANYILVWSVLIFIRIKKVYENFISSAIAKMFCESTFSIISSTWLIVCKVDLWASMALNEINTHARNWYSFFNKHRVVSVKHVMTSLYRDESFLWLIC